MHFYNGILNFRCRNGILPLMILAALLALALPLPSGRAGAAASARHPFMSPVAYNLSVTEDMRGGSLVLEGTLPEEPDRVTLMVLADRIYEENNGPDYEQVLIHWHIKDAGDTARPWAVSDITAHDSVLRLMDQ